MKMEDRKSFLAHSAVKIMDRFSDTKMSDTQVRKYANTVLESTCYPEFKVYVQYQIARNRNYADVLRAILEFLDDEFSKDSIQQSYNERLKLEIAYFFGVMARYKKYLPVSKAGSNRSSQYTRR